MSPTTFARLARRVAPATLALVLVACDTTTPATPAPTATPAQTAAATLPIATPPPSAAPTPTPTPEPTAQTRPESTAPWTSFPSLLQARTDHSATALPDGRILVVGGETRQWDENDDVTTTTLASVEIYRPATGAWEKGPDLHVARSGHAAVLLKDGRVLVFGGGQATPTMMEDVQVPSSSIPRVSPGPRSRVLLGR